MDPIRREMLLSFLIVFVAIWLAIATGDFLLASANERFRIIPMDTVAARFWSRRLIAFAGHERPVQIVRLGPRGTPSIDVSDEIAILAARP